MTGVVTFESDPPAVWGLYSSLTGGLAFDVGANGGMTAARLAEGFDRVIAYEPAVESYDTLCSQTPDNVEPVMAAVTGHAGEVQLDVRAVTSKYGELTTGNGLPASWGPVDAHRIVRAVTLDDEAARVGDPDLVKIDTEGHEVQVVKGGLEMIARRNPALIIEVHSEEAGLELLELLPGRWEKVSHPLYQPDWVEFRNHYWLLRGV